MLAGSLFADHCLCFLNFFGFLDGISALESEMTLKTDHVKLSARGPFLHSGALGAARHEKVLQDACTTKLGISILSLQRQIERNFSRTVVNQVLLIIVMIVLMSKDC